MIDLRRYWVKVFWKMAHGNKTDYDGLRGAEVEEFWYLLDEYELGLKKK